MREIKFRAWVPSNHWIKNGKPSGYIYDWQYSTYIKSICFVPDEEDGIIVEQFTGLYDINGKEIYEGDIVGRINMKSPIGIVEYVSERGGYDLKNFNDSSHVCCDWLRCRYEVVGNINENPEFSGGD